MRQMTKMKMSRLAKCLRQSDIALRIGIPESHFAQIEIGRIQPKPGVRARIAEVLGLMPEELFELVEKVS